MAYHPRTGKTVLFGGTSQGSAPFFSETGLFGDTWVWDGQAQTWTEVPPDPSFPSPPSRANASLAEDPAGNLVLFGGTNFGGDTKLPDTWVWDGARWHNVTPERDGSPCDQQDGEEGVSDACQSPPARVGRPALAYHDSPFQKKQTVLFGGAQSSTGGFFTDTWAWDGLTWKDVTPTLTPPGRVKGGMAYDRALDRIVLFGGRIPDTSSPLRDTWTWDGTAWAEHSRPPAQRPPPDEPGNGMAYWEPPPTGGSDAPLASAHVLVLSNAASADTPTTDFSPETNIQFPYGFLDTWTWDGRGGLLRVPEPDPPDVTTSLTLALHPEVIPADGSATSKLTARVTFGGDPAPNLQVSFRQYGDLTFERSNCITNEEGECSTIVRAGILPGDHRIDADAGTADASTILTLLEVSCGEQPSPEQGPDGWWGNLDLGFGCHGRAVPRPPGRLTDMVVQPEDGKIVVVTEIDNSMSSHLTRYLSNGRLDPDFGTSGPDPKSPGMVTIRRSEQLALQKDGKLLTLGFVQSGQREDGRPRLITLLSRFNPDGSPDNGDCSVDTTRNDGFGEDGTSSLGEFMYRHELVLQPDGKILASVSDEAAGIGELPAVVIRINPDGSPDNGDPAVDSTAGDSFGDGGRVTFTYREGVNNRVTSIGIQKDEGKDKIVLGGGWSEGYGTLPIAAHWGLARLLPNGDFDPSFNACPSPDGACGGKAAPVFQSNYEDLNDLLIQPQDGKIVAVGAIQEQGREHLLMGRFNRDGTADAGFNPCGPAPPPCGGKISTNFGGRAVAYSVDVQPDDGKLVLAGHATNRNDGGYLLARFNQDGTLDDTCGLPPQVVTHFAGSASAYAVAVHNSKIVAGGVGTILRFQGGSLAPAPSEITVQGATVNEPGQGQTEAPFNVKLKLDAPACQPMAFEYATSDGSATAGQDYTQTKGTVMFQRGQQEQIIPVPVLPDDKPETPETFNMSVSNSVGLADPTRPKELKIPVVKLAEGQATILDPQSSSNPSPKKDDLPGISIADTSVIEGNQGTTTATLAVALTKASKQKVTVDYQTQDDTAKAPGDYRPEKGTITFEPGQTQKTITIQVATDLVPEPTETLYVQLQDPRAAAIVRPRGAVTIYDDDQDQPPTGKKSPSGAPRIPTAAGLLVPGANPAPPSLAQGTQIQAQQQTQQQAQAQLMAGVMTEKQRQAEVEKAGLDGKDAYLATARRQTSPSFAWAFGWLAALVAFGAGLAYRKQTSKEPAINKVRKRYR